MGFCGVSQACLPSLWVSAGPSSQVSPSPTDPCWGPRVALVTCSLLSVLSMHVASATVYMYIFCNPCINYLLLCNKSHQNVVPSNNSYFLAYNFWGSGIRERRSWVLVARVFPEVESAHHMPRGRTHTAGGWRLEFLVCGPLLRLPEYSRDMVVSFSQSEGARPSHSVLYAESRRRCTVTSSTLWGLHRPALL